MLANSRHLGYFVILKSTCRNLRMGKFGAVFKKALDSSGHPEWHLAPRSAQRSIKMPRRLSRPSGCGVCCQQVIGNRNLIWKVVAYLIWNIRFPMLFNGQVCIIILLLVLVLRYNFIRYQDLGSAHTCMEQWIYGQKERLELTLDLCLPYFIFLQPCSVI